MPTYDICGSIRIVHNSEDQALDVLDELVRTGVIDGYHYNEIEVQ